MASTATTRAAAVPRLWHVVDARNQIVGRLAPQLAHLLAGKHKPTYVPHVDAGDYVVVVNARHAVLTGNKMRDKLYKWHTGWMGGLKSLTARQVHERAPERLIEHAVKGMLAPNNLRKERLGRLRIFPDEAHEHARQVAQSERYAPQHLAAHAPRRYSPPPAETTGTLVREFVVPTSTEARAALDAEAASVMAADNQALEAALAAEAANSSAPAAVKKSSRARGTAGPPLRSGAR